MRKSNSHIEERPCPSFEALSAGLDRIEPEFGRWSDHLQNCSACREVLNDMQRIDRAVKQHVESQSSSSEQITVDIKREFYRKIELAQRGNYHTRVKSALQLAAAVVICSAAIFWALRGTRSIAPVTAEKKTPATSINPDDFPYYSDADASRPDLSRGTFRENTVALHDFMPAGYGSDQIFVDRTLGAPTRAASPADIAASVSHVWIIRDSAAAAEALPRLTEELDGKQNLIIEYVDGRITLTGEMSKLNLARLVKLLHRSGFELISPQSPQPEDTLFRGSASTPVYYSARFLTADF